MSASQPASRVALIGVYVCVAAALGLCFVRNSAPMGVVIIEFTLDTKNADAAGAEPMPWFGHAENRNG